MHGLLEGVADGSSHDPLGSPQRVVDREAVAHLEAGAVFR
jgi:hypothetical protein